MRPATRRRPEVSVRPFEVERPPKVRPPVRDDVAFDDELMIPPVKVIPFDDERPTVVRPWKVEEAVVEVATRRPNAPTPPWMEAPETMFVMRDGIVEVAPEVR